MGEQFFGEDQVELMYLIKDDNGEEKDMTNVEARIKELDAEIEGYRNTIVDAEGALDSAEKELDEVLQELS